jgi:hypothetical protein
MEIIRPVMSLALLALFALTDSLIAQPAAISCLTQSARLRANALRQRPASHS